jgi:hypothetical protein
MVAVVAITVAASSCGSAEYERILVRWREEWDTEENLIFTTFLMMRAAIVLQHDVGNV